MPRYLNGDSLGAVGCGMTAGRNIHGAKLHAISVVQARMQENEAVRGFYLHRSPLKHAFA